MLHSINTLPTHLIVGVKKAATTWIWKQVENRKEVSTAVDKEIWYFTKNYHLGINWYKKQFKPNKVIIDNTPDYFHASIAKKIYNILPNAKIMVCLRNPVERALSHFKHARFIDSIKKDINFMDAWRQDMRDIRKYGLYNKCLEEYIKFFGKRFEIYLYDDLTSDSFQFIKNFYKFLGIEFKLSSNFEGKWIPCVDNDNEKLNLYNQINKDIFITRDEKKILFDYYRESIHQTEKIIGRDLSSWLK